MEGNKINGKTVTEEDLLGLWLSQILLWRPDVFYNKDICAHVGNYVRGDSNVFEVGRRPWLSQNSWICWNNVYKSSILVQAALSNGSTTDKTILAKEETTMPTFTFEDQGDQIILINSDTKQQAGEIAFMEAESTLIIVHTGVNPEYRGNGLAEQLVAKVVEKGSSWRQKSSQSVLLLKKFKIKPEYADVLRQDVWGVLH